MSHSQATKDFLNDLADKLRQLQFEAEEYYTALQHPLNEKDEAEWDRIIGSIMGAVNTAQWPDAADPLEPVYSHLDEHVDPLTRSRPDGTWDAEAAANLIYFPAGRDFT